MELILETNVCVSNLKWNSQENRLKMSITFLTVGVLGLLTENAVFQLLWNSRLPSKLHQPALWISVHLQGLCSCSLQAGRTLWEMSYALPSTVRGWTKTMNISCPSQYQQFLLAQVIRPTASLRGVSKSLFSWLCPVIRDIWSGKSSQTLCFIEIWNYLSWNETNLDNSIPTLHGRMPCPSPHICSMESFIWVPVPNKPLTPWLAH